MLQTNVKQYIVFGFIGVDFCILRYDYLSPPSY